MGCQNHKKYSTFPNYVQLNYVAAQLVLYLVADCPSVLELLPEELHPHAEFIATIPKLVCRLMERSATTLTKGTGPRQHALPSPPPPLLCRPGLTFCCVLFLSVFV